jgi:hypothetical protein
LSHRKGSRKPERDIDDDWRLCSLAAGGGDPIAELLVRADCVRQSQMGDQPSEDRRD